MIQHVLHVRGLPIDIIIDRGLQFSSVFMESLLADSLAAHPVLLPRLTFRLSGPKDLETPLCTASSLATPLPGVSS